MTARRPRCDEVKGSRCRPALAIALPLERLAAITSFLMLAIFATSNLAGVTARRGRDR